MNQPLRISMALSLACLSASCDESCPPGYVLKNHACVVASSGGTGNAGGAGNSNIGGQDADADVAPDSGTTQPCTDATFNKACMSTADCGCDTDFCAASPGQQGFCSHTGCLQDPSVCPATWSCMDLSMYQPGLNICIPS